MDAVLSRGTTTMYVAAFATLILTSLKAAPYGRYASPGGRLPGRFAWFLFESPNLIIPPCLMFVLSPTELPPVNSALLAFFLLHYTHRALIYPLRMPRTSTPMPVAIVLLAAAFTSYNACLQTLGLLLRPYPHAWFRDPRFILGFAIAIAGMVINVVADSALLRLRKAGRYRIPRGPLFRLVSCPNFLGEIMEWSGWAIACWSHTAAAFALYTFCNIAPRARSHHRFYIRAFDDYPKERKALIPFVL